MNKVRETLETAWNAARYSFAFCLRNNKRDTIIEMFFLVLQTVLGYCAIIVMGKLITSLQAHITSGKQVAITVYDFIGGGYFFPVALIIAILFIEIIVQKLRSFISTRRRHILRFANNREMYKFKASLDVARTRSKLFDDIVKKIDELPNGWYTRISFAGDVMMLSGDMISFAIFSISLSLSHPIYVAIIILTSVPMVMAEFTAMNRIWKLSLELIPHQKLRGVLERAYHNSTSFLQGLMFNQMPTLDRQIRTNHDHVIRVNDQLRWSNVQITLGAYLVAMAGLSFVLLHSVWNTLSTGGDLGTLTIIIASSRRLQASTRDIVLQIAGQWSSAKGMIIIEKEFFGMKPLIQTEHPVQPEFDGPPTIRFENVSFSYPERDVLVLKDISFSVKPGEIVTIVGRNGSGKSSLMGLLLRHYDPTAGRIQVGDINLRNITPATWSNHASALLQDFVIHDRSIGEEIASSRLDQPVDMEKVREAAQFARFMKVVDEDPKGFGSQIGTEFDGREFSGGQEQSLAASRARYRDTPIFILDEPDAKLDPETAQQFIDNVYALKGKTVIVITQHVSRAAKSDKIIVLDAGEIVEQGTHAELIELGGKYASMFDKDKARLGG